MLAFELAGPAYGCCCVSNRRYVIAVFAYKGYRCIRHKSVRRCCCCCYPVSAVRFMCFLLLLLLLMLRSTDRFRSQSAPGDRLYPSCLSHQFYAKTNHAKPNLTTCNQLVVNWSAELFWSEAIHSISDRFVCGFSYVPHQRSNGQSVGCWWRYSGVFVSGAPVVLGF